MTEQNEILIEIPHEFEEENEQSEILRQEIISKIAYSDTETFSSDSDSSTDESSETDIETIDINMNENEIITLLEANKRWEEYEIFKKEQCEGKEITISNGYGFSVIYGDEEELYTLDNMLIGILVEKDNSWQWDWGMNLDRSVDDLELVSKLRLIIEKDYNLTLDKFWTTNELLIKYIVATATVELGFDNIKIMDVHHAQFVVGQRVQT